jgi:hypothetical protein
MQKTERAGKSARDALDQGGLMPACANVQPISTNAVITIMALKYFLIATSSGRTVQFEQAHHSTPG